MLRRKHVNQQLILQRVEYEMNSPDICVCRGAANGITSLLNYAASVSHEPHGFLLQPLVSALFPRTNHALGAIHLRSRLLAAEKTVLFLQQYVKSEGEGYHLLLEWAKQASLPVAYSLETTSDVANVSVHFWFTCSIVYLLCSDCDILYPRSLSDLDYWQPTIWTPELSGLATGRPCSEYLPEGELYESVLRKLFAAIQPTDSSDIYLACLNSLRESSSERINSNYMNGSWARIVLLGQRIADKKCFDDVNEDVVKKTVSSISGALGALRATSDPYLSAVLICLSRRLLIPFPCFPKGKQRSGAYQQHKEWFRQFVVQHGRKTVEGMVPALMQLLPLEPLELLRNSHRVFSTRRELALVVSDYLVSARSRISELDPVPRSFLSGKEAEDAEPIGQNVKDSPKLILTTAHYIKDFARTKELPRVLLRQINFHRYHFQKTTRVALLDPLLSQYVAKTGDPHFIAGRDVFETHQINLITYLAFKRKDKAISASEANVAIKSIREARNARLRPAEAVQESETDRRLNIGDSLQDIITECLEAQILFNHASHTKMKHKGESSPTELLRLKMNKMLLNASHPGTAKIGGDVLHGLFAALSKQVPKEVYSNCDEDRKPRILRDNEEWWVSTGKALRGILIEVFGDSKLRSLQKSVQYQLFALICTATDSLSPTIIRSAAMLTVTILTLHTEPSLTDLCFASSGTCSRMSLVLNVIIECLPFNCGIRVRNSVTFIFHCTLLLHSAAETVLDVLVESHDAAEVLKTQRTRHAFQAVCKEKLGSLFVFLQWILCFPWRLLEDGRFWREKHYADATKEESSLLNKVSKVLVFFGHKDFQSQEVARILAVELQCGWGREDAIYSFFERLECVGKCNKPLLLDAIKILATKSEDATVSRGWIQNALVRFARDRSWCQLDVNGTSDINVSGVEFLCQEVEGCGAHAGREIFDLFVLADQCFFHGLSLSEAVRHIMFDLTPRFWPLPRRYIVFVVHKLKSKCVRKRNLGNGIANMHLFTANVSAEVVNGKSNGGLDGLSSDLYGAFPDASIVQEILGVTDVILALDRGSDECVTAQVKKHSVCLGSALILSLCRNGGGRKENLCKDLLMHRVSHMCRILPPPLACEVLDSALSTAAVIPFCLRFCKIRDPRLKMKETTEWMKVLTSERLALSDSRYTVPVHTREELRGDEARKDPLIQTCLQWLGRSNQSFDEDPLGNSLPIAVCMGRVFGVFRSMDKTALKCFLEKAGWRMTTTLVSNALHTYESLEPNVIYSSEKLPSECIGKLKEVRLEVQRDLLQAIGGILRAMREVANNDFEECLTNMLRPYQGLEDEVRSALSVGSTIPRVSVT
ncbi:hypothetical protein FGB62_108g115 [Gracilaria domingensis]|nr:hypothetical protein FGB62_108g115 [Gracilaria domingensis]